MNLRTRFLITAIFACHCFLSPQVLTSQLRSSSSPPAAELVPQPVGDSSAANIQQQDAHDAQQILDHELQSGPDAQDANPKPPLNVPLGREEVLIQADQQGWNQDTWTGTGHVVVRFRMNVIHCDQATYDSTTGIVTANGHVVFDGGQHNEHITSTHGSYDVSRDTGTFYDASGSTGVRVKNKLMFLTSSTPFFFSGKVVDKLGPDQYLVHHGYITSCQLPKPKWRFVASTANVEIGEDARMHHATLRIGNIPVFYFPYAEHPIDNLGRKSGFLIPVIGISNTRGTILGDGFYWAINRSSDANIGVELYSKRGWAQHGEYRAVGYKWHAIAEYFGVVDSKGYPGTGQNQGGEEAKFNGDLLLPYGFRGVASIDYLSSYLFRLAFGENYVEAVNSEVRSSGFISRSRDGNYDALLVSRYQNYQSSNPGDVIDIAHLTSFQFTGIEKPIAGSRFMYTYDAAAEGLSRHEPGFQTASIVGRGDIHPAISLPEFVRGWTLRPELGAEETLYSQRLQPATTPNSLPQALNEAINRNVLHFSMEVRPPTLEKIFDHKPFGYVLKHTFEPFATYRYQTGIGNFDDIIRFDYRDILADTNEVEYGVTNRLYAKKTRSSGNCFRDPHYLPAGSQIGAQQWTDAKEKEGYCDDKQGGAKEIITWTLAQKYFFDPTFGGAVVNGARNVFDSSADFTGIAFIYGPRRFSPIISRLRFQDNNTSVQWDIDYDTVLQQLNASTIILGHHWRQWYASVGHDLLKIPPSIVAGGQTIPANTFNQVQLLVGYGSIARRGLNAAASIGYDYQMKELQYGGAQTTYNWDCCGVTFEYRRWALGTVRNENYYRFALSLANFGTFGNIRRQDRLY
jgi:LPS-assembly protein